MEIQHNGEGTQMMTQETEEAKEGSIREITILPEISFKNKKTEPYIVIDRFEGKIRIIINQNKRYRVLHEKNLIENALDILIVDTIKELLETLAKREEEHEEELKKFGGENHESKVRESSSPGAGNTKFGSGGTPPGDGGFV